MRVAIIMAALIIAEAIRPKWIETDPTKAVIICIGAFCFGYMDWNDYLKGQKK